MIGRGASVRQGTAIDVQPLMQAHLCLVGSISDCLDVFLEQMMLDPVGSCGQGRQETHEGHWNDEVRSLGGED